MLNLRAELLESLLAQVGAFISKKVVNLLPNVARRIFPGGKLLAPRKWVDDEDGTPTTTIRAKRIVIVD